jgi:hypothetical protein
MIINRAANFQASSGGIFLFRKLIQKRVFSFFVALMASAMKTSQIHSGADFTGKEILGGTPSLMAALTMPSAICNCEGRWIVDGLPLGMAPSTGRHG